MDVEEEFRDYQLSPSSWNRFEECPRKYWLSRQGLPRKASMPSSMGTAIHNSVEDLCNLPLGDKDADETGWLPTTAKEVLDSHWEIERWSSPGSGPRLNASRQRPRLRRLDMPTMAKFGFTLWTR